MSEKTFTKQTLKKYNPLLIIVYRQLNKNGFKIMKFKKKVMSKQTLFCY